MPLPTDYWASYEHEVSSLADFLDAVRRISAYQAATGSRFVWRGAANSSWALHSSLVRSYRTKHGTLPSTETELRDFERDVVEEAHEWSLDWHGSGGRLMALELLAALQHYGVPTRMLDFTYNPLIALWFAVETVERDDGPHGRVFAVDISGRLVTRGDASSADPWWLRIEPRSDTEWTTQSWIWRPPPLEPRIVRQEGCFLMGGIPSTNPARKAAGQLLHADEVRACMSVPFRLIKYAQAVAAFEGKQLRGAPPKARAFTLKVANKPGLRAELEQAFGYSYRSLFPDFAGLAAYGRAFR
jgi:FRG domain